MVAANVMQSFDEAGLNNADEVAVVGKKWVRVIRHYTFAFVVFEQFSSLQIIHIYHSLSATLQSYK